MVEQYTIESILAVESEVLPDCSTLTTENCFTALFEPCIVMAKMRIGRPAKFVSRLFEPVKTQESSCEVAQSYGSSIC
jgi:hypothetical protein